MRPYCERVMIAGSIRREKEKVKDAEIVFWPRMEVASAGDQAASMLFDVSKVESTTLVPTTERMVAELTASGLWRLDARVKRNGPRHKRLLCRGLTVELYRAGGRNWGWIQVLRTGPAEFSHALVTPQWSGGFLPVDKRVKDGVVLVRGQEVSVPTEQAFFDLWGIDFIEPPLRSVGALRMVTVWRPSIWNGGR
ncbi:MAG: hypothetical protein GVY30_11830 [Chloroflexi bacterium]|nr:hypothetical protein [Chloroflexota bacterium]